MAGKTTNNVPVNPGDQATAFDVATVVIDGIHYPVYFLSDANGKIAYVDQYSGAIGTIDQEHLKIHQGKGFTLAKRIVIDDTGGATPTHEFLGIVPAGVFPHFRSITVSSDGGPVDVDLYEGTTVSANGTAITPYNNNRNSGTTAAMTVFESPTITTDGTLLEPIIIPGTKQQGSFGSEASNEWNLKADTIYMIRITNNTIGAGTSRFTLNMFWYE